METRVPGTDPVLIHSRHSHICRWLWLKNLHQATDGLVPNHTSWSVLEPLSTPWLFWLILFKALLKPLIKVKVWFFIWEVLRLRGRWNIPWIHVDHNLTLRGQCSHWIIGHSLGHGNLVENRPWIQPKWRHPEGKRHITRVGLVGRFRRFPHPNFCRFCRWWNTTWITYGDRNWLIPLVLFLFS